MAEPTTSIEVVSTKRGKCICCTKPGRRRKIVAKCGKNSDRTTDIFCLPCAKNVAKQMKWSVVYGNRPTCCQNTVELGLIAGENLSGQVHSHRNSQ